METADKPYSLEKKELKSKIKYFFKDDEKKINFLLKEENKNKDLPLIHYPLNTYEGIPKYSKIRVIQFDGFKNKVPKGISTWSKGYGFVKLFNPMIEFIESKWAIEKIIIKKSGTSVLKISEKTLVFSEKDYLQLHEIFTNQFKQHLSEKTQLSQTRLHKIFPKEVEDSEFKYIPNTISSSIANWKGNEAFFSESDKNAIVDIFLQISDSIDIISNKAVLRSKEVIEEHYIEDVIALFEKHLEQETETPTLEKKWQEFLSEHNWIFSHLFSFPVLLYQSEAYVGGKTIKNDNGKVGDFVLKNGLTNNLAFIEIKTHNTELMSKGKPYRGTDVFSISHDLSGAINQVLNQKDTFQKEFWSLKGKSKSIIESFNSKCIVVLGKLSELKEDQIGSFELFRSNSKDVEIITFDELLLKLKSMQKLMKGDFN